MLRRFFAFHPGLRLSQNARGQREVGFGLPEGFIRLGPFGVGLGQLLMRRLQNHPGWTHLHHLAVLLLGRCQSNFGALLGFVGFRCSALSRLKIGPRAVQGLPTGFKVRLSAGKAFDDLSPRRRTRVRKQSIDRRGQAAPASMGLEPRPAIQR